MRHEPAQGLRHGKSVSQKSKTRSRRSRLLIGPILLALAVGLIGLVDFSFSEGERGTGVLLPDGSEDISLTRIIS